MSEENHVFYVPFLRAQLIRRDTLSVIRLIRVVFTIIKKQKGRWVKSVQNRQGLEIKEVAGFEDFWNAPIDSKLKIQNTELNPVHSLEEITQLKASHFPSTHIRQFNVYKDTMKL